MFAPRTKGNSSRDIQPPRKDIGLLAQDRRRSALSGVEAVLSERGNALPGNIQAAMGARMSFDFSRVRVHADAAARSSARALGARGWTLGEHVVLGERAGADTLAHELAHVVQQSGAPAGEKRLGGEDSRMEREAASAAWYGRPPRLKASAQTIQRQPEDEGKHKPRAPLFPGGPRTDFDLSALSKQLRVGDDPFQLKTTWPGKKPGPGYGDAVLPGHLEMQLTPLDQQHIDLYLVEHGFHLQPGLVAGTGEPVLDGKIVTMEEIADRVAPLVLQGVGKDKIRTYLGGKYIREMLKGIRDGGTGRAGFPTEFTLPLTAPPAGKNKAPGKIQGWQTVIGAGTQVAWHANVVPNKPTTTPQDTTIQFQVGRNYAAHPDKESGSELQGLIQVGYNVTTHQYVVLSGGQFTEVISLFDGLLQVAEFVQLLGGIAMGGGSVSGQIQPSAGGQALVQLGPIQIGGQFFFGATVTPGGESTFDRGGGLVIQANF